MPIVYEEEDVKILGQKERKREYKRIKKMVYGSDKEFASDKEKMKAYLKEYYQDHKEKIIARAKASQERLKSIDDKERDERLEESSQLRKLKHNLEMCRKNPLRARVSQNALKQILIEEEQRRAEQYLNKDNMKKRMLCIVGDSGVGKTLVSLHLKNHCDANVICSFTTRPPRETEVEGRDHHFIDVVPPEDQLLAYAEYGAYKYYALKSQVFGPLTVYVVDEVGLLDLMERHGDEFEIYSVYIMRDRKLRLQREVSAARMNRDKMRKRLDLGFYNYVIENNGTKKELFNNIERIYSEVKEK